MLKYTKDIRELPLLLLVFDLTAHCVDAFRPCETGIIQQILNMPAILLDCTQNTGLNSSSYRW